METFGKSVKYIILSILAACIPVVLAASFCVAARAEEIESAPELAPIKITVVAGGKEFTYSDEKIYPSDFTVAEQIEMRNINASLDKKIETVDVCLSKGADHKTALDVCFPLLKNTVNAAAEYLYVAPVDAQVVYERGAFKATKEKSGRQLDEAKLYAGIYCALKFSGGGSVKASVNELQPEVTQSQLQECLNLRGSYTTDFSTSTAARAHNVRLALEKIGGIKIEAGETLSFNETVGERTESNGFQSAKIIVDGKYTDGVGGGVCQASTAVYNAALLSGLHCNANAHSICPSYCPAGLDAMISEFSDLTITNTTSHPVFISVKLLNSGATVAVFGEKPEYVIVPESVTVKTVKHEQIEKVDTERKYFDESAQKGDRLLVSPGKDGVFSQTYLNYYKGGEFIRRVRIRENEYRATPQVIAVAP